jgi:ABC-2 type transport system permease protein
MNGFTILLKKELKEQLRTYKLLIAAAVFLLFGLGTPLLIKYTPQLIEMAGEDLVIEMPPPSAAMAIAEYTSTIGQIGVLVAVLVGMGAVARERSRGTAAMVLSKPVRIGSFIIAKLTAMSATFISALILGSIACYTYTVLLIEPSDISAFMAINLLVALFLVVCLAITLFFSSIFRNQLAAGGIALAIIITQALLTQIPGFGDYLPARVIVWGTDLAQGQIETAWGAVGVSIAVIIACLYFSRLILQRREL